MMLSNSTGVVVWLRAMPPLGAGPLDAVPGLRLMYSLPSTDTEPTDALASPWTVVPGCSCIVTWDRLVLGS